jgi:hypothetical protein
VCDYPGCPQRDVPVEQKKTGDVFLDHVVETCQDSRKPLNGRAPSVPNIVITRETFEATVREGSDEPRNKVVDEIPTNGGITPEDLEGVKVDEDGFAASDNILEAILCLKEAGYRVLTAEEADLEKKAHEGQVDALRGTVDGIREESNSKDEIIKSLAARITEAMAVVGAFSSLATSAATITPGSLSRVLSRILLSGRSLGEHTAFVGAQLSYTPAEEYSLRYTGNSDEGGGDD